MIDWLEELLAAVDGEDEDGQEDALALEAERAAAPAPASGDRAGNREQGRAERPGAAGSAPPEHALDARRPARAEIGRRAQAPGAAELRTEEAEKAGAEPAGTAEAGLERLYRRTAQAGRLPAQGMAGGTAAWTRPEKEPGQTAALTVDELDRAVKRDSRRYDGGMSIF